MKFAILTDIHLGLEGHYKWVLRKNNKDVKIFLDDFIEEMNNKINPEFVIVLGDVIEDENEAKDKKNVEYIVDVFKKLKCPVHYVAGNHDLKKISEGDLIKLFHQKSLYYSFDSNDLHHIVLFSKDMEDKTIWISEEQKIRLQKDLNETSKNCVIFVHHSLADQDLTGNPRFEWKPERCLIANREDIRYILAESKKVIAVFNSHLHWDRQNIHDNIPYFTIQSLVENEDDKWIASEAHAIINIHDNKIGVEIRGNYPKKFLHTT